VPVTFREACAFVEMWHRHLPPARGHVLSIGVATDDAVLRGVATVGRPVARLLQDGRTLEVNRAATDGTPNANSALYGAAWRAARALGWTRLVTYTQDGETGASLRAAGWRVLAERPAHSGWDRPSRPRTDRAEVLPRTLWEASA
jgi:hypothetical protein